MKKIKIALAVLALAATAGMSGCTACDGSNTPEDPNPPVTTVSISSTQTSVTIKDYLVEGYNFARYFRIRDDGELVPSDEYEKYIDASAVRPIAGEYEVFCKYKDGTASIKVKVEATDKKFSVERTEVKINTGELKNYDFKSLFSITADGRKIAVTDAMITSDVKAEEGEYTFSVTFCGETKSVKVTVVDENKIEIIKSYGVLELTKEELEEFDYTSLFSLYVGGIALPVLEEYLDLSEASDPQEGQSFNVTMSYSNGVNDASSSVAVRVVDKTQVSITSKNVVTYPNGEDIDLKSLFTIKIGVHSVEVTDDMISGTVDYSCEGDNIITLSYGGRRVSATVSIKLGVIIGYASSDTVYIEKGTDISSYDFGSDFTVIINGIRFTDLSKSYFDTGDADFDKEGEYTVKIIIPYNTKGIGISGGVKFDYFEETITYKVVENKTEYSIRILQENLILPAGTQKYTVYDNLEVVINGITCKLHENKDWHSIIACYAQTVSAPIDFNSVEEQLVEIDVYVYGPDADPVRVEYTVRIDNGVKMTGSESVVFTGTTVYARDLFTITENGRNVPVTDDMLSGKIDLFTPGIYFVTATYKGVTAQSKAVVLNSDMTGTYKTALTGIEVADEDDEDDGWGDIYDDWYGDGGYSLSVEYSTRAPASRLQNLTIDENGDIYWGSKKAELISIIDDSTFYIRFYTYEYVFHYGDGIITLDPDTSLNLTYNDYMRPMVYFNSDKWTITDYVQVNSSINGYNVLQKSSQGNLMVSGGAYTIDLTGIKSVESGESYWYGMKTTFLGKSGEFSKDTHYADEVFGFATMAPDFEKTEGCVSSVNLGGANYAFTMQSGGKAIINKNSDTSSAFAGMSFKGTLDGKTANFAVAANGQVSCKVDGKTIFELSASDQSTMKNGGANYADNTWLVYDRLDDNDHKPFSYRFRLDVDAKTFTVDERDELYGRYVLGDVVFFFDGYGTGEATFTESKYLATAFSYRKNGANVEITYLNPEPTFSYGKSAKFLFADYKNILTVREITGIDLVGKQLINTIITDGAIVQVKNLVLGKGVAEKELFDGITVQTKDGYLTAEQMKSNVADGIPYVDVRNVGFGTAGFYQLKINIPVNGEIKTSYYAVQVLDDIYSGDPLVGRYSYSAVNNGATLILDEFGRISGEFAGVSFNGTAKLSGSTFTATAECATGKLTIEGELLAGGIVKATARGALMFTDCFTTGSVRTSGTEGLVFRIITAGSNTVYMLANSPTSIGNVVEVEGDANTLGSVLKITDGNNEYVVKLVGWNINSGLVASDAVRGVYTLDGADDLILDGFGNATLGASVGTYTSYGSSITVISANGVAIYRINTQTGEYTVSETEVNEALFADKSFSAQYSFVCNHSEELFSAVTVFEFKADGKVIVKSSSAEHDECGDLYAPEFATAEGLEGTFAVAGNKITVTVNGKTIVFTFTDAVGLIKIKCYSADVSSSSQGYFRPDTEFLRV